MVNQAPLSIVPDNLSRAVGQANPALTYTFSGFVNGDTAATSNITGTADLSTTADADQPGGQLPDHGDGRGHAVVAELRFPSADFGTGTLTVTQSAGTSVVVGSTLPNSTYGQSVSFTVTVSGGGPSRRGRCSSWWTGPTWARR